MRSLLFVPGDDEKKLAKAILPELHQPGEISGHDSSTNGLINYFKARRGS